MPSLLVTVGTDGSKDWIRTPDGQRFALGPVSVLNLVTRLSRNTKVARRVLDEFLKKGEAMLAVDDAQLWTLLAPRRARWAAGPFMALNGGDHLPSKESHMRRDPRKIAATVQSLNGLAKSSAALCTSLDESLGKLESEVRTAGAHVLGPSPAEIDVFRTSLAAFRSTLSKGGSASRRVEASADAELSFDRYASNMRAARGIVAKAQQTVSTIEKLASAGKRFDAARARADVARVTAKVASICSETELTESWVESDLAKLAARTDKLHRLFHPERRER